MLNEINESLSKFEPEKLLKKSVDLLTVEYSVTANKVSEIVLDKVNKFFNVITTNFNNTSDNLTKNILLILDKLHKYKKDDYIEYMQNLERRMPIKLNSPQNQQELRRLLNKQSIPLMKPYTRPQVGGAEESEFMKYVYTKNPIWFTKKDMIWN